MSETLLSSRNLAFELYEVLDAEGLTQRERFAEHNRETFDAALGTARNIAEKFFAPHNRKGDENEPRYEDGQAILIPEVKPAVDAFLKPASSMRRAVSKRAACNRHCCPRPASRISSQPTRRRPRTRS
jgi:hypothetical protein